MSKDELFAPTNPLEIVGWTVSNTGTLHAVTADNNYRCKNKTKIGIVFTVNPEKWDNRKCGNCERLVAYDGR